MTDLTPEHYELPHAAADSCVHAGVGKACRPCREAWGSLTPEKALDEIRAEIESANAFADHHQMPRVPHAHVSTSVLDAILARVTPSETVLPCSGCDTPRAKCDEWKTTPDTIACCPECNHTPTAVPGAGEVGMGDTIRLTGQGWPVEMWGTVHVVGHVDSDGTPTFAAHGDIWEVRDSGGNDDYSVTVLARAAITALRNGEVGGE